MRYEWAENEWRDQHRLQAASDNCVFASSNTIKLLLNVLHFSCAYCVDAISDTGPPTLLRRTSLFNIYIPSSQTDIHPIHKFIDIVGQREFIEQFHFNSNSETALKWKIWTIFKMIDPLDPPNYVHCKLTTKALYSLTLWRFSYPFLNCTRQNEPTKSN